MLALTLEMQTWAHRVPAGVKLAALACATILLLPVKDPTIIGGVLAGAMLLFATFGMQALFAGLRLLRPLVLILVVIVLWHVLLAEFQAGLVIAMRILALVMLANAVTMTTRMDDLIGVLTRLLGPLRWLGISPHAFALAVALTLRWIPVLASRGTALRLAWRARSPRRPGIQTLFPLVLMALDDADRMSDALRARGGLAAPKDT
jgi:biotin transport system permease protein